MKPPPREVLTLLLVPVAPPLGALVRAGLDPRSIKLANKSNGSSPLSTGCFGREGGGAGVEVLEELELELDDETRGEVKMRGELVRLGVVAWNGSRSERSIGGWFDDIWWLVSSDEEVGSREERRSGGRTMTQSSPREGMVWLQKVILESFLVESSTPNISVKLSQKGFEWFP